MSEFDSRPETRAHIARVQYFLERAVDNLNARAENHDRTKLESPEVEEWDRVTPRLAQLEYGSEEYKASLRDLEPTLKHHYEHNDHHPEHFEDRMAGMSLMALLEMVCDWRAASERTKQRTDGPTYLGKAFLDMLDYNQKRWGFSDELKSIIAATARELEF